MLPWTKWCYSSSWNTHGDHRGILSKTYTKSSGVVRGLDFEVECLASEPGSTGVSFASLKKPFVADLHLGSPADKF